MPSDPLRRADAEFLIKFFNDKSVTEVDEWLSERVKE